MNSDNTYDVIVLGLGGMGSAALFEAAKRGLRCLGLDPNGIAHSYGSSHGETRLIRQAYFEHPDYVPLLKRAYDHWHERNQDTDTPVFHQTGLTIFGSSKRQGLLSQVTQSAKLHNIPIEDVDPRSPAYHYLSLPEPCAGILEPGAGYLDVERAIRLHIDLACQHGAQCKQESVTHWEQQGQTCLVSTKDGSHYKAKKLVLCLGPWSPILARLPVEISVKRVPLFWFRPKDNAFQSGPCFAFQFDEGFFYGFREQNGLVKIAPHIPGDDTTPDQIDRNLLDKDKNLILSIVKKYIPGIIPEIVQHKVCMYSMSEDEHFYLGLHPACDRVTVAAGMSGHGYKFAPVIGEVLIDLATKGTTELPAQFLSINRLAPHSF